MAEAYVDAALKSALETTKNRNKGESEFLQAVEEVLSTLRPLLVAHPEYCSVLSALLEPERMIMFRVPWEDDQGKMHVNRGFRVQFSSAIGPYKGGLRFHPSVNLSIIKFLGFEQVFKNSLTTLAMGGGKGGSDFDPKGKSDGEVRRFCQSFMTELNRHIGQYTDVPAGDIGVGGREIGFMFGQFKRIQNQFQGGVLTGKATEWGGSFIRPEATGYGLVYLANYYYLDHDSSMAGKHVLISGSGNVAKFAAQKLLTLGAHVYTMSDSSGTVYEPDGFTMDQVNHIFYLKDEKRARIAEYAKFSATCKYYEGKSVWDLEGVKCDIAIPCATQNEIDKAGMERLVKAGCKLVVEGANMPSTNDAIDVAKEANVAFLPAKAANAGGVAVSGLEMAQCSARLMWTSEVVDARLQEIMKNIYDSISKTAKEFGKKDDFQFGANAAGFIKVAKSMLDQGLAW